MKKSHLLVLGIGNTIKGDDAVGIICIQQLKNELSILTKKVDLKISEKGWLDLIDILESKDYKKIIIVDAIKTGKRKPGYIYILSKDDFISTDVYSSHNMGLSTIFKLFRIVDIKIPDNVTIYGIEIENDSFCEQELSSSVKEALKKIISLIKKEIKDFLATNSL